MFFNIYRLYMNSDFVIIGGGISGLYCYNQLLKNNKTKNKKIILLEQNPFLGGRIYTDKVEKSGKKYSFEAGAGRFGDNHKRLKRLMKEVGVYKDRMKIPNQIDFIDVKRRDNLKHHTWYLEKIVKKYANKQNQHILSRLTFKQVLNKNFSPEIVKYVVDSYEYKDLFKTNAYAAVNNYYKNLRQSHQFYILKGGLSNIIKNLSKIVKKRGGDIRINSYVQDIKKDKDGFLVIYSNGTIKKKIKTKNIIFTITNKALAKFKIFSPIKKKLIESVRDTPLTRIYSVFDNKNIWFNDIIKTTTTSPIQYVIPINEKEGSIMSSYTDLDNAVMWFNLYKKSEKKMEDKLIKELSKIYDMKIPRPKFNKVYHWQNGVSHWLPGYNVKKVKSKIVKPFASENLYIAGENYSSYQGWMEGALETSDAVLKKIFKSASKTRKRNFKRKNKTQRKNNKKKTRKIKGGMDGERKVPENNENRRINRRNEENGEGRPPRIHFNLNRISTENIYPTYDNAFEPNWRHDRMMGSSTWVLPIYPNPEATNHPRIIYCHQCLQYHNRLRRVIAWGEHPDVISRMQRWAIEKRGWSRDSNVWLCPECNAGGQKRGVSSEDVEVDIGVHNGDDSIVTGSWDTPSGPTGHIASQGNNSDHELSDLD